MKYDLEDRCIAFLKQIEKHIKSLPNNIQNREYSKQLIRSAGSIGANYIEVNEATSKKDFVYRLKIAKKEARETRYWLKIIASEDKETSEKLVQESTELIYILVSILIKVSKA